MTSSCNERTEIAVIVNPLSTMFAERLVFNAIQWEQVPMKSRKEVRDILLDFVELGRLTEDYCRELLGDDYDELHLIGLIPMTEGESEAQEEEPEEVATEN